MKAIAPYLGAALVLLGLLDVYFTVLFSRSGVGLLSPYVQSSLWRLVRAAAKASPRLRDRVLSHAGPALLSLVALTWVVLLLVGFGLVFWPQLGSGVRVDGADAARPGFNLALVYSGYNLTTLGANSMTPQTPLTHWLSVAEAGCGLGLFTLMLTYILQVYNAVLRMNHLALKLHHSSAENPDAAEMVARLGAGGDFSGARGELATVAEDLLEFFESHHFYPAITYFRFAEAEYAAPRMVLLAMDAVTLIRTGLDGDGCDHLDRSEAVAELHTAGMHFLKEITQTLLPAAFQPGRLPAPDAAELERWRRRYRRALERFGAEGIRVTADPQSGAERYVRMRREWDAHVKALARFLVRDWKEVAPHEAAL
jgi:hypothetical protein